jgi:LysM repeat protein
MLTATTAEARRLAPRPPTVHIVVRRRQVLLVLLGVAVGSALLAGVGLSAFWWLAGLFTTLAAGYLALVARLRHLRVRRQMDLAFGWDLRDTDGFDWHALERELQLAVTDDDSEVVDGAVEIANRALGRFLLCWALGWVLTPVVTVIRLLRGDPAIGFAHRIVRLQQYGRSQSLRLLTVGAAASVSITAVGGFAGTAGAGASPLVAAISTTTQTAAAPVAATSTYTVVAGDTLSAIARGSATSVQELAATNHLANPNLIFPGEVLTVMGGHPGSVAAAGPSVRYLVQKGDTLSGIARTHGTTVAALAAANGITNPNFILPGRALNVPAGVASSPALAAATPATRASMAGSTSQYVVRTGDELSALARRYHTTAAALAATNHLANPNFILPGQVLRVPATAAASTTAALAPAPAVAAAAVVHAPLAPAAAPPAAAPAPVAKVKAPAPPASTALSALPLPPQFLRGGSVDQGVDYSAPGGTPLYAMGPGKIIRAGMSGFGPNCPVLQITAGPLAGQTVYYGHAGPNLVPVGATVAAGQQISIVGYGIVGYSTGPHLEIGFYPPGGNGSGRAMLNYINGAVGHSTAS